MLTIGTAKTTAISWGCYLVLALSMITPRLSAARVTVGERSPGLALDRPLAFTCIEDTEIGTCVGLNDADGTKRALINQIGVPLAIEYDRQGNLYVGVDNQDTSGTIGLWRLSPAGVLTNIGLIIELQTIVAMWNLDLAVSPAGEVYFTHYMDTNLGTGVSKINAQGVRTLVATDIGNPSALEFDSKGNLYIGSLINQSNTFYFDLYKVTPSGVLSDLGHLFSPLYLPNTWDFDLAVNDQDEIYFTHIADATLGTGVSKRGTAGTIQLVLDGINEPCSLAFDQRGDLYIGSYTSSTDYHLVYLPYHGEKVDMGRLIHPRYIPFLWSLDLAIPPAPVEVLAPRDGDALQGGSLLRVDWRTFVQLAGTAVSIELWKGADWIADLGHAWEPAGEGESEVYLPLVPQGNDYHVRVRSVWNPAFYDDSNGSISISGGAMRILSPEGATTWHSGSGAWIHWQVNSVFVGTALDFELWRQGAKVADLGQGWDPDGEGLTWIHVPSVAPGSQYSVRAISLWNSELTVQSSGLLTIENDNWRSAVGEDSWQLYQ